MILTSESQHQTPEEESQPLALMDQFRNLISQPGEIQKIGDSAVRGWNETFQHQIFKEKLTELLRLEPTQIAEQKVLRKYFKDMRKAGQYLRTSYSFLDLTHECSERLSSFLWQLGQINDLLGLELDENQFIELKVMAEQLLGVLGSVENWPAFTTQPDSPENVIATSMLPYKLIDSLVRMSLNGPISSADFHQLRKKLRLFANIYTLAVQAGETGDVSKMKHILVNINDELGSAHDELVRQSIRKEVNYHEATLIVPQKTIEEILQLLNISVSTSDQSPG